MTESRVFSLHDHISPVHVSAFLPLLHISGFPARYYQSKHVSQRWMLDRGWLACRAQRNSYLHISLPKDRLNDKDQIQFNRFDTVFFFQMRVSKYKKKTLKLIKKTKILSFNFIIRLVSSLQSLKAATKNHMTF